jgi:hypothetical protein
MNKRIAYIAEGVGLQRKGKAREPSLCLGGGYPMIYSNRPCSPDGHCSGGQYRVPVFETDDSSFTSVQVGP